MQILIFTNVRENGIENGNVFRILNMLIRILFYWNTFFFISSVCSVHFCIFRFFFFYKCMNLYAV